MIANDAHRPDTTPAHVNSIMAEEGRELVEEPDQLSQDTHMQRLMRNERIRLVILGTGILAIILSAVFFLFTGYIVTLFVSIVIVPLFYWSVDVYLGKSGAYAR